MTDAIDKGYGKLHLVVKRMDETLTQRVARAILEVDPTCDYDKCRERIEKRLDGGLSDRWWEALHRQADAAIAVVLAEGEPNG